MNLLEVFFLYFLFNKLKQIISEYDTCINKEYDLVYNGQFEPPTCGNGWAGVSDGPRGAEPPGAHRGAVLPAPRHAHGVGGRGGGARGGRGDGRDDVPLLGGAPAALAGLGGNILEGGEGLVLCDP